MTEAFEIFAPSMISSFATVLAGIIIVLFATGSEISRREVRIFAAVCILVSLGILPRILRAILANHGLNIEIPFFITVQIRSLAG